MILIFVDVIFIMVHGNNAHGNNYYMKVWLMLII